MRHLTSDELVDLAEGTRPESSASHLQSCERCRGQLANLRAMMSAAAGVDVPEPSPLFWNHLSAHVGEAVSAEGAPRRASWVDAVAWWRLTLPLTLGAVAMILLAVIVTLRLGAPNLPGAGVPAAPVASVADSGGEPAGWANDPSLDLVADLAADVDWDAAGEPGLTLRGDAADKAVGQLSEAERRELQRLLKEELAHSGA